MYPTGTPAWLAFDPNDGALWVAVQPSSVDVIPGNATANISAVVPVGSDPFGVAVDSGTNRVFVTNTGSDNVSVLSDVTDLPVASVPVGIAPGGIAVDPVAREVYVANTGSNNVSVISESTLKVVASIPVGPGPFGLAVDRASGHVLVANRVGYTLSILSIAGRSLVATVPVGVRPYGVAVDNATDNVYVTNQGSSNVSVLNASTGSSVATIPIVDPWNCCDGGPTGIAYDPLTRQLWVGDGRIALAIVNATTETVAQYVNVDPSGVAWDPIDRAVCVTNTLNQTFECVTGAIAWGGAITVTVDETGLPSGTAWSVLPSGGGGWTSNASAQGLPVSGSADLSFVIPPVGAYVASPSNFSTTTPFSGYGGRFNVSFLPRPTVYPVTFTESGLSAGAGWSVDFGGDLGQSNGSTITFRWPSGTYAFGVGGPGNYNLSPSRGYVVIAGAGANVSVAASPTTPAFSTTFTETGLPNGTPWYLNGTSGPPGAPLPSSGTVTGPSAGLGGLVNGTYRLSVQTADRRYATAPTLTFTESNGTAGPPGVTSIRFAPVTYPVTFQQRGLPNTTRWSVRLGAVWLNGTGPSQTFASQNGSFLYTIAAPAGYSADPVNGVVVVAGSPIGPIPVNFTSTFTYEVTFRETGLPTGTGWAVAIGGQLASATSPNLTLVEPNGTFGYVILDVPGYSTNYSGSVRVAGANASVAVAFVPQTYPVIVVEFGLAPDTNWSVTVVGTSNGVNRTLTTNGSALLFYLPNGTYSVRVSVPSGYTVNLSSAVFTVAGTVAHPPTVSFTPVPERRTSPPPVYALPLLPVVVGTAAAAALVGVLAMLLWSRRGRGPSEELTAPSGALPSDPSLGPPSDPSPRPRLPSRPEPKAPAGPLDDAL